MSGGFFNYEQYKIDQIASQIEQLIYSNDDDTLNEWGYRKGRHYTDETITEFHKAVAMLKFASMYAQRIDYLVSGDDGEESFHKQLAEDYKKVGNHEV